jgi:hypothetical protein
MAQNRSGGAIAIRTLIVPPIIEKAFSKRLTRFLDYPVLDLSNNLAENAIRPVALGRGNWIHVGSEQAGPRVAAIVSIVESCGRLNVPLRDCLGSVLPGLVNRPISQLIVNTPPLYEECPQAINLFQNAAGGHGWSNQWLRQAIRRSR